MRYTDAMNRRDLVAGLSVAGLMLPEAVAYAGIAGLAPGRAVLAAIAGSLAYAAVGRSRFAIVSPTSSSAAILAAALAAVPGGEAARGILATVAVAMAGGLFLIAAGLRLGGLTGFIARPVLRGFAFGLAITIILRQLPTVAGVSVAAPDVFRLAYHLAAALPQWHLWSVATGVAALAALLAFRRMPALPGAFLVLVLGIAASAALDLSAHGVAIVGAITVRPAMPQLPDLNPATLSLLAQMVVPLVLILFAESWGTMRALALRHGDTVAPDRELGALGVANLASAIVQGLPVGAGFSAGSANEAAGATSRWAAVAGAIGLAVLVVIATPYIALLPEPVLAAVVIVALLHALDPAPLLRLWTLDRDQYVALASAIGVLLFGVLNGMLIAIALSIAALVRRLATPQLVELGRLDGGHDFIELDHHPEAARVPGIAVWRAAEPLIFANAERVLAQVTARLPDTPGLHAVVLSIEESFDLDSTTLDALTEFAQTIQKRGLQLRLARVRDAIRDLFTTAGAADLAAACSYSVDDAVAALSKGP
jgi:MFS superfamily sulfate permease-like transporter